MNGDDEYFLRYTSDEQDELRFLLKRKPSPAADRVYKAVFKVDPPVREEMTESELNRLEELLSAPQPQGPRQRIAGKVHPTYFVMQEIEQNIGLEWYVELTKTVYPWSKDRPEGPQYIAYWEDMSRANIYTWNPIRVIAHMFDKRIDFFERIKEFTTENAKIEAAKEFSSFDFGLPISTCEICGNEFRVSEINPETITRLDTKYFQRTTCSETCREERKWLNDIQKGMQDGAQFDVSVTRNAVWERFGPFCYLCGIEAIYRQIDLNMRQGTKAWKERWGDYKRGDTARIAVVEHVYPRSKGGTHTWDNVRIACTRCNLIKGDSIPPSNE